MGEREKGRRPESGEGRRFGVGGRAAGALLAAALLAAAPLAVGGCGGDEAAETGGTLPTPVEAAVAIRDTLTVTVRSVGSLEADALVEVRAEAEGRVSRILFQEGEQVRRGQPLLLLEREKLRVELAAAEAAEARARAEAENLARQLERNRGLLEAGAISPQAFDDLRAAHDAARARLAEARATASLARQRLEDATVRAPFAGRVGERSVDRGDFVRRGDPLFALVDDDSLEIGFSVPERYIGRLSTGSPVELRVASFPDRAFEGLVTFVSPVVDSLTRTVRMKARVPNPAGELRAGQFANVELGLERREGAILVPEAAVVPREGESFVYLVRGGVVRRQVVRVGERVRGMVEVVEGVAAGDTVVVAGQQKVRDGSPVAATVRPPGVGVEPVGEEPPRVPGGEKTSPAEGAPPGPGGDRDGEGPAPGRPSPGPGRGG